MTRTSARFFVATLCCVLLSSFGLAQFTFSGQFHSLPSQGLGLVAGDFNRDGMPDLAVAVGNNSIEVFLASAPGQYGAHVDFATPISATGLATADFNGDGVLDLLAWSTQSQVY